MSYTRSKAQPGRSSILSIGPVIGTSSPTFTPIFEVRSAPRRGAKWETEDVSNFNSGVDKEFITNMRDNGTIEITGNRVSGDAGQTALKAAFATGGLYMFTFTLPLTSAQTTSGDVWAFNALVESVDYDVDTNKVVTFTCSLKLSGIPTETAGT